MAVIDENRATVKLTLAEYNALIDESNERDKNREAFYAEKDAERRKFESGLTKVVIRRHDNVYWHDPYKKFITKDEALVKLNELITNLREKVRQQNNDLTTYQEMHEWSLWEHIKWHFGWQNKHKS